MSSTSRAVYQNDRHVTALASSLRSTPGLAGSHERRSHRHLTPWPDPCIDNCFQLKKLTPHNNSHDNAHIEMTGCDVPFRKATLLDDARRRVVLRELPLFLPTSSDDVRTTPWPLWPGSTRPYLPRAHIFTDSFSLSLSLSPSCTVPSSFLFSSIYE